MSEIKKLLGEYEPKIQPSNKLLEPSWPRDEYPLPTMTIECPRCGLKCGFSMGYVCPDTRCPIFPRIVC